jgi:hypothetical protein
VVAQLCAAILVPWSSENNFLSWEFRLSENSEAMLMDGQPTGNPPHGCNIS